MTDEFGLPEIDGSRDLNESATGSEPPAIDDVKLLSESEPPPSRPPGPGLPESLLWTLGVFITLLGASAVWGALFVIFLMVQGHQFAPGSDFEAWMDGLSVNERIMMMLPPSLLAFMVLIPLGLWRLGRHRLQKLNFSPPSLTQLVIVLAAVFPTTIISTPMFEFADAAWTSFCEGNRLLEAFNEQTSVMKLMEQLENGSLFLLLFFLAVVPAVGEEFVFRGVVGRGLVARWGVWWGVLFTSVLFALLHTYPPHVAAVLPIGVMMHIVYLTTRSFWAPVIFHFANNAMAATFVALGVATEDEVSWWMPPAALAYLALSIGLLYYYRTRYVNEEGEEISPGYVTVAKPPPEVVSRREAPVGWIAAPLFGLVLAATCWYIITDAVRSMQAEPDEAGAEVVLYDQPAGLGGDGRVDA